MKAMCQGFSYGTDPKCLCVVVDKNKPKDKRLFRKRYSHPDIDINLDLSYLSYKKSHYDFGHSKHYYIGEIYGCVQITYKDMQIAYKFGYYNIEKKKLKIY
jgi:hypothetical protein